MPEKTTPKEHGEKTAPPSEKESEQEVVIHISLTVHLGDRTGIPGKCCNYRLPFDKDID